MLVVQLWLLLRLYRCLLQKLHVLEEESGPKGSSAASL